MKKEVKHLAVLCDEPGQAGPCMKHGCRYSLLSEARIMLDEPRMVVRQRKDGRKPRLRAVKSVWFDEWPEEEQREYAEALQHTCSLYWADAGGLPAEAVAVLMGGIARQRVDQLVEAVVKQLVEDPTFRGMLGEFDGEAVT